MSLIELEDSIAKNGIVEALASIRIIRSLYFVSKAFKKHRQKKILLFIPSERNMPRVIEKMYQYARKNRKFKREKISLF